MRIGVDHRESEGRWTPAGRRVDTRQRGPRRMVAWARPAPGAVPRLRQPGASRSGAGYRSRTGDLRLGKQTFAWTSVALRGGLRRETITVGPDDVHASPRKAAPVGYGTDTGPDRLPRYPGKPLPDREGFPRVARPSPCQLLPRAGRAHACLA